MGSVAGSAGCWAVRVALGELEVMEVTRAGTRAGMVGTKAVVGKAELVAKEAC